MRVCVYVLCWFKLFLTQDRWKTVTYPMYSLTLSIFSGLLKNNMYINKVENNMKRLFVLCLRHTCYSTLLCYSIIIGVTPCKGTFNHRFPCFMDETHVQEFEQRAYFYFIIMISLVHCKNSCLFLSFLSSTYKKDITYDNR